MTQNENTTTNNSTPPQGAGPQESPSQSASSQSPPLSQVSTSKGQDNFKHWAWHILIGIILLVLMSTLFFKHSDKKSTSDTESFSLISRYSTLETPKTSPEAAVSFLQALREPVMTKEQEARQNAPTKMYSASLDSSLSSAGSGNSGNSSNSDTTSAEASIQVAEVNAKHMAHPSTTIASGELIHGILETAIHSDLPGMVRAIVSHDVYSYTGERLIIPAGSRLLGQYASGIAQGQNRVMIIWERILLPNGITVTMKSPGADTLGRSGQGADGIDRHFVERFGQATLLSLIGAGVANVGVKSETQNNSASDYRTGVAQSFQQSANASLASSSSIKTTLTIFQGANINVFVAQDLDFYAVLNTSKGKRSRGHA